MTITGQTRLLGVIGKPVRHSRSPSIYNHAFELMNLDFTYLAFEIDESETKGMLDSARLLNMAGLNVTMPCKQAVIPFLDEISPQAKAMAAVNTIVSDGGKLKGYNTDGIGMLRSIEETGVSIKNKNITLFGVGGAATAIMVSLASAGAKSINLFNRSGVASDSLKEVLKNTEKIAPSCKFNLYSLENKENIGLSLEKSDIIINATPLGMSPNIDSTPIEDKSFLRKELVVVDAVYNPVETKLLKDAAAAGCKTVDGRGMLFWQAVEAFRLFTGKDMPIEETKENFLKGF